MASPEPAARTPKIAVPVPRTPEEVAAERAHYEELRARLEAHYGTTRFSEAFRKLLFEFAWQEGGAGHPAEIEAVYADLETMLDGYRVEPED